MCVEHVASFSFAGAPLGPCSLDWHYLWRTAPTWTPQCWRTIITYVLNWPEGQSLNTLLAFIHLYAQLHEGLRRWMWVLRHTHKQAVQEVYVHLCVSQCHLCVDVKQGGKEIGRSSLVAGKWGDLFFGSFPVKFPGDRDTENIYLYPRNVLHTVKERGWTREERER